MTFRYLDEYDGQIHMLRPWRARNQRPCTIVWGLSTRRRAYQRAHRSRLKRQRRAA